MGSSAPRKCSRENSLLSSVPVHPCSVHPRIQNTNLKNVENPVSGFPIYSLTCRPWRMICASSALCIPSSSTTRLPRCLCRPDSSGSADRVLERGQIMGSDRPIRTFRICGHGHRTISVRETVFSEVDFCLLYIRGLNFAGKETPFSFFPIPRVWMHLPEKK